MRTLDRTKPFGEVYGASDGTRYYQDNTPFDGLGNEIGGTAPPAKAKKPAAPKVLSVDAQLESQLDVLS